MPKVSIVVPIYNVEKYLEQCLDSIINQTLKDIEIILVDDGSPDNCPQMCDDYAKKDSRIKVVHKKNGGLSSARNAGIEVAIGDYIGFIDSDDYIELDMYEKMYNIARESNVDFVMSDYYRVSDEGKIKATLDMNEGIYDKKKIKKDIFPTLIMGDDINYGRLLSVWNCLYKRELLYQNNLMFDEEVKYSEDNLFSSIIGYKANSFYYMKGSYLYNYRYNPNSISKTYKPDAWSVYLKMNNKLKDLFLGVEDYNFRNQLNAHIIYYAFNCINHVGNSDKSFSYKYKEIKRILNTKELKDGFKNFKAGNISTKLKISIWMLKHKFIINYMIIKGYIK
ncbi:glycosyltransferase family 2 protein [Intestinibacter bartlettii]|uniref:glycosyltransferase family 2 protein n=1 Tax=Intestinibacter bartlettii TaxID=261299 RepID=UPI002905FB3A|nr:glycosyltransferase [Intestinibacter bartlettii]MDU6472960.1 glycosyltransferase [Intestinibacter bartlettii]